MSRGNRNDGPGRRLTAAAAVLTLLLAAGCAGSEPPPAQAVPELHGALSKVDQAIVGHRPGQARRQLRQLIKTTVAARDAGRLDPTQADAVLAAAASLLNALPQPQPKPEPAPKPTPQPKPKKTKPHKHHKGPGHGHDEGHGNQDEGNGGHGGEGGDED